MSMYKRIRDAVLPIKPEDSRTTRTLKQGGFFLFMTMALLVTGAIALAVAFVL